MNDKDYYAILGVEHDADDAAIRKAFQKLARKYHPDINKEPGAEEKFKEISEAYAVLSDPDKRRRYDAMQSGNPFAGASYGSPSQPQGDPFGGMGGFWGWGTARLWDIHVARVAQPAHRVKDKRLRRAFGILDTARWLGFVMVKGLLPTPVRQG